MGRIRASFGYFLDVASEQVACSTGVLLSDANISNLASRHHIKELRGKSRTIDHELVFRAEEFEDIVLRLRVAIGELPDNTMGQLILVDASRTIWATGGNPQKIVKAFLTAADSGRYEGLTSDAIEEIAKISGQETHHILSFATAWSEFGRRTMLKEPREHKSWDGAVQLDRLFEGEHIPTDPTVYLDQRYIDYLAKNDEEMVRMHWRNFERLTTEFFKRQEYEVDLGQGTKDGGVDVRVWTDKDARTGPPLLLVQCKRSKNVVGIETVKAFWTDVAFAKAERGLIATTSTVSRDSKTLCDVRQWPMSFAEGDKVKEWARTMWRLRTKGRRKPIAAAIEQPVGLASFVPGARPEWFRDWMESATQDYSKPFEPLPDDAEGP